MRAAGVASGACCDDSSASAISSEKFGDVLYDAEQRGELPEAATLASLGCGNPTAVAELQEGEAVLDLGSGGGIDVILSAKRVGPTGYGLRSRHDRRDAGARAAERARGGRDERSLPEGCDRADPAAGGLHRRRDLELRDQSLGRQARGVDGDGAGPAVRAAGSGSATSSPRIASARRSAPSAVPTSAASPVRSRRASTRRDSRPPGSSRSRSSSRTRSPTGCTARSSRPSRRISRRRRDCPSSSRLRRRAAAEPSRAARGLLPSGSSARRGRTPSCLAARVRPGRLEGAL